jgi:hypothetical protein
VLRHRGKSPRQTAFFFRSPELKFHAANLASLFLLYGLLRATSQGLQSSYRVGSLESGALVCGGYEAYRELHSPAAISFEHAWFLLLALGRRDEIALTCCPECGGVRLNDLLAKHRSACASCDAADVLRRLASVCAFLAGQVMFPVMKAHSATACLASTMRWHIDGDG